MPPPSSRCRPDRYRPHLEPLEQRKVPAVLTVTNLLDQGAGSLRAAVASAQDGDTVQFAGGLKGQITLTTGEIAIPHSIGIDGPGADVITVSGNHASRVFDIAVMLTVDISGLTIADGSRAGDKGGGILNAGTLTVANSLLSDNFARFGGGIANSGTLTVVSSTLSYNSVFSSLEADGGGIYNQGTLVLAGSVLSGNSASDLGGGIDNTATGQATITGSTLDGSSARGPGGAILNQGTLTGTGSILSDNMDFDGGAGILNTGTLIVTGFVFRGNSGYGSIYNAIGGQATLTGCTVDDTSGPGIINYGSLTVTDSRFANNAAASAFGGGIFNVMGTVTVIGSVLTGNLGGAIANSNSGTLVLTDSLLSDNPAPASSGGGLFNFNRATATVTRCTFSRNTSWNGGGIFNDAGSTLAVIASTLDGNSASQQGGGIGNQGRLSVTNSTISGNSADEGGGLYSSGRGTVTDSTISGNSASNGGGIDQDPRSGTTTLRNTILAGDRAPVSPDVGGPVASQGHNLIGDGIGGSGFLATDLVGTADNPIDPLLGPLQDNGGPTQTMALLVGSPAIAAGDPTDAPPTDQRGAPRLVNGAIDIGAYEVQAASAPSCAVAQSSLGPPNGQLINVGLGVQLNADADPSTYLSVQIYANDNANASDAADIGPDTLQLRSERQGNGQGRVYLVVATATDASGQTGFDVCTVVVPHDQSARSRAEVQAEAAAAAAYYQDYQTAPAGYALLGEGPEAASSTGGPTLAANLGDGFRLVPAAWLNPPTAPGQPPTFRTLAATGPTENALAGGTVAPVDGYFAAAREETSRFYGLGLDANSRVEADDWVPDPWLSDWLFAGVG